MNDHVNGEEAVRIEVEARDDGWRVSYIGPDGGKLVPPRHLESVGAAPLRFPKPPAEEAGRLEPDLPHRDLCVACDVDSLLDALAALSGREPGAVETVGRYLFEVLLGEAWPRLEQELGRKPGRLELSLPLGDAAFSRFAWELVHDGEEFLTLRDGVTLLRLVESPANRLAPASTPLDVLFVVGRGLRDDAIRPAAEYLGLLQNLQALDLDRRLRPRLLLEATTEVLQAALAERRPAVMHVITHGRSTQGRAYLEMRATAGSGIQKLFAPNLLELLKEDGFPLPVVVLSACETGITGNSGPADEVTAPFAAELVQGGVPLAVGMSGPVGDLACRLFARAFYSALLSGRDAAAAASAGRRAAVQHGGYDSRSSYDWALPSLFVSRSVESLRLEVCEEPLAAGQQKLARELDPGSYPVFCDRLSILATVETLLAGDELQRRLTRGAERQVLGMATATDEREEGRPERYGRTWALRALAARAVLLGHVPCLVSSQKLKTLGDPPTDWHQFVDLVNLAMEYTAVELGVDVVRCDMTGFLLGGDRPGKLPDELENLPVLPNAPNPLHMARALRHDLLRFLDIVRSEMAEDRRSHCRLLLLIDDLHRMGDLAADLLDQVFGPFGLRRCRGDVRVAFTWARRSQTHKSTCKSITDWFGDVPAEDVSLDRFENLEERLAYQHFLFHYRDDQGERPLALAIETRETKKFIDAFLDKVRERVGGVPSKLTRAGDVIDVYLDLPQEYRILVEARDEDVVQHWLNAGGPPP